MDREAGWWTTSGNIGLPPPLARVMGVGRQQQQDQHDDDEAYIKYREMLQKEKVSKIWKMSLPQHTMYDIWSDKIIDMKKKCDRKRNKGK